MSLFVRLRQLCLGGIAILVSILIAAPLGAQTVLTNDIPVTGITGGAGGQFSYRLTVPGNVSSVVFTLSGGTGNADLYVKLGSAPTTTVYDFRSINAGTTESISIPAPASGDYFVVVRGVTTYSSVALRGTYVAPAVSSFLMSASSTSLTLGQSVDLTVTARNSGSGPANTGGYMSLAFRELTSSTAGNQVSLVSATSSGSVSEFAAGATIYNVSGNAMSAQYLLAEFARINWAVNETNTYVARWTPTATGTYTIEGKAALQVAGNSYSRSSGSGNLDQQGAPVQRITITVNPAQPVASLTSFTQTATTVPVGQSVDFRIEGKNIGSGIANTGGYLSVAIRELTSSSAHNQVSTLSPTNGGSVTEYAAGQTIYHTNGSTMLSQYLLVEYARANWSTGETNSFVTRWVPTTPGTYTIEGKTALQVAGNNYSRDPINGSTDQQGASVRRLTVTVTPPPQGTLTVTVRDEAGFAFPTATVLGQLFNSGGALVGTSTNSGANQIQFANVPPGNGYRVDILRGGIVLGRANGITVNAGANSEIINNYRPSNVRIAFYQDADPRGAGDNIGIEVLDPSGVVVATGVTSTNPILPYLGLAHWEFESGDNIALPPLDYSGSNVSYTVRAKVQGAVVAQATTRVLLTDHLIGVKTFAIPRTSMSTACRNAGAYRLQKRLPAIQADGTRRIALLVHGYVPDSWNCAEVFKWTGGQSYDEWGDDYFRVTSGEWRSKVVELQNLGYEVWSYRWPTDLSIQDAGAELRRLADAQFGVNDRIVVFGHSMGGLVGRSYASNSATKAIKVITSGTPNFPSAFATGAGCAGLQQVRIANCSSWSVDEIRPQSSRSNLFFQNLESAETSRNVGTYGTNHVFAIAGVSFGTHALKYSVCVLTCDGLIENRNTYGVDGASNRVHHQVRYNGQPFDDYDHHQMGYNSDERALPNSLLSDAISQLFAKNIGTTAVATRAGSGFQFVVTFRTATMHPQVGAVIEFATSATNFETTRFRADTLRTGALTWTSPIINGLTAGGTYHIRVTPVYSFYTTTDSRNKAGDIVVIGEPSASVSAITPVSQSSLAVKTAPAGGESGRAFGIQPAIQLVAANGSPIAQSGVVVNVLASAGNGALFGVANATTDVSGIATFTNLGLTGFGVHTLTFSSASLTPTNAPITVSEIALANQTPVTNQSAPQSAELHYKINIPSGQTSVDFISTAGTGNADLYVRFGQAASASQFDCKSTAGTNNEICTIPAPQSGDWYVMLKAASAFSGVQVVTDYDQTPITITTGSSLPGATVGASYSTTLSATGGASPVVWSIEAGSTLPSGLLLNAATGVISGIPTTAAANSFTIRATSGPVFTTKVFSLTIAAVGQPVVRLSQATWNPSAPESKQIAPSSINIDVTNAGPGILQQIVSQVSGTNSSWLTASLSGTSGNVVLSLTASHLGLVPGQYAATVDVTALGASSASVQVTLSVTARQRFTLSVQPGPGNGRGFAIRADHLGSPSLACKIDNGVATLTCQSTYLDGDIAVLTYDFVSSNDIDQFVGWGGACNATNGQCQVVMNSNAIVTAAFRASGATVTGNGTGVGRVNGGTLNCQIATSNATGACASVWHDPSQVQLLAAPDPGSVFVRWGGDCATSTSTSCSLFALPGMTYNVQATFDLVQSPDLVAGAITLLPPSPLTTQAVVVSGVVNNAGTGVASGIAWQVKLDGSTIASGTIPSLGAGASAPVSTTIASPHTVGQHLVQLVVDPLNAIAESNESNNSSSQTFTASPPATPDLVAGPISITPSNPLTTQSISATASASNAGNAAASNVGWSVTVDGLTVGGGTIQSLPAGATVNLSATMAAPLQAGQHVVELILDPASFIPESSESNNTSRQSFTASPPATADLVAGAITLTPPTPLTTQTVNVSAIISNAGSAAAVNVAWQLRSDGVVIASGVVPQLAVSATTVVGGAIAAPHATGQHSVQLVVDPNNSIQESSEANNSSGQNFTASLPVTPDLVAGSVTLSPSNPLISTPINVTAVATNSGNAIATNVGWELRMDGAVFASGVIPSLSSGGSTTITAVESPPHTVGQHLVEFVVDASNQIVEASENNNLSSQVFTASPPSTVDLVAGSISLAPTNPLTTQAVTVTSSLTNSGNVSGTNVVWQIRLDGGLVASGTIVSMAAGSSAVVSTTLPAPHVSGQHVVQLVLDPGNAIPESSEANNSTVQNFTASPPATPDLIAASLVLSPTNPTVSTPVAVSASVNNSGNASAANVAWELRVDGSTVSSGTIPFVAPGASTTVTSAIPSPHAIGQHTVEFVLDPLNLLAEASELNNRVSQNFTASPPATVDLVAGALSLTPNAPLTTQSVAVTASVANSGNAVAINVGWQIKLDGVVAASGTMGSLAAGANASVTATLTAPHTVGQHAVQLVLDPSNAIAESSEANNTSTQTFTASPPATPDLLAGSIQLNPPNPLTTQSLAISAQVSNAGNTTATNVAWDVKVDGTTVASGVIPTLAAGASTTVTATDAPPHLVGQHMVQLILDAQNTIAEASESNNISAQTFTASLPSSVDLVAGALTLSPASPLTTQSVSVAAMVVNAGNATSSNVAWQIRLDGAIVATGSIPSLVAGGNTVVTATLAAPHAQGQHLVQLTLDPSNVIVEASEANNSNSQAFTASPPSSVDLVASTVSVSPSNALSTQTITVTAVVGNAGNTAAANAAWQVLLDGAVTATGVVTSLGAGGTVTISATLAPPHSIGQHTVTFAVDPSNAIAESSELNNTTVVNFTANPPATPDAVAGAITLSPTSPLTTERVSVSATVSNAGSAAATNLSWQIKLDGIVSASGTIATLAAGASTAVFTQLAGPHSVGQHSVTLVVDPSNSVAESSESNNTSSLNFTASPPATADLVAGTITLSPPNPLISQDVAISAVAVNAGNATAFNVGWEIKVDGVVLTSGVIPSLAAGASAIIGATDRAPHVTGQHSVQLILDPASQVSESSESNNSSSETFTANTPATADVVATRLVISPSTLSQSQAVILSGTVGNLGNAIATNVEWQLKVDGVLVERGTIPTLAPGASVSVTGTKLPSHSPGAHFASLVVDPTNAIQESSEINNSVQEAFNVVIADGPELEAIAVVLSPTAPTSSQTISLTGTVRNSAPFAAASVGWEMRIDGTVVGGGTISTLASGASTTVNVSGRGPYPLGVHNVEFIIDPSDALDEFNELNNTAKTSFVVSESALPDLVARSVSVVPATPTPTSTIELNAIVVNDGSVSATDVGWQLRVDGTVVASGAISTLVAGASANLKSPALGPYATGKHLVQLTVDPGNAHVEKDETNNATTLEFIVGETAQSVLTVTAIGDGGGSIVSSPSGISCVASNGSVTAFCSVPFPVSTSVTLNALPIGTSVFTGWSGACSGILTCVATMTQARSVTASFSDRQTFVNALADYLLGIGSIDPAMASKIDTQGNGNGALDVGDLLALLDRTPSVKLPQETMLKLLKRGSGAR